MPTSTIIMNEVLPCGLRVSVCYLPEGTGTEKAHVGEYLWCVESARIFGRAYDTDPVRAQAMATACAQQVLARSQNLLIEKLFQLNGGASETASSDDRPILHAHHERA